MRFLLHMFAVGCIFALITAGWTILGTATTLRSEHVGSRLGEQVEDLWGGPLTQTSPALELPGIEGAKPTWIMPERSVVDVELALDHRRKGLVWYPTYACAFSGTYTLANPDPAPRELILHFALPDPEATYDGFTASLDGEPIGGQGDLRRGIRHRLRLPPGGTATFAIAYTTRGMHTWRYALGEHLHRVNGLALSVTTDFAEIDFPEGSISPHVVAEPLEGQTYLDGHRAAQPLLAGAETLHRTRWAAGDIITSRDFAVEVPARLNPGPLASRIIFFGPVCLFFFFALVGTLTVVRRLPVHPMHYFFVGCGFFAFHLLLAYLVDHLDIHLSFALAAAASLLLVTSYTATAFPRGFTWKLAACGQLVFLILFSYSFFLDGATGLTVAVGAVLTLAVIQWATARVDWYNVFGRKEPPPVEPELTLEG